MEDPHSATVTALSRYIVTFPTNSEGAATYECMLLAEQSAAQTFINETLVMNGFQRRAQAQHIAKGLKLIRKCCTPFDPDIQETPETFKQRFIALLRLNWTAADLQVAETTPTFITDSELLAYKRVVDMTLKGCVPYPVTIATSPPNPLHPQE